MISKEFDENLNALKSQDAEEVERAIRNLGESSDQRAIPFLLDMLLKEHNDNLRNVIALSLGSLKADDAVPILIQLVKKPELKNKRGSLVYALQNLDCKNYFIDIVELICDGNYEVCNHALDIFESLVDEISYSEKLLAKQRLSEQEQIELALPPSKHPKYDRIHFVRDALKMID